MESLSGDVQHFSFQTLKPGQMVNSVIHIRLKNAEKVINQLDWQLAEIPYASKPEDMIDVLTIDVDGLKAGTVVTLADLPELCSGRIELHIDKSEIVLRLMESKTSGYIAERTE